MWILPAHEHICRALIEGLAVLALVLCICLWAWRDEIRQGLFEPVLAAGCRRLLLLLMRAGAVALAAGVAAMTIAMVLSRFER